MLCWLATTDVKNQPNVSPKEIFCWFNESLLIANIASPGSAKNILSNPKVAISFIDILSQKGYQLKGTATLIREQDPAFSELSKPLLILTSGKYPFNSLFRIEITKHKRILAPSYIFYPEIEEAQKIQGAKKQYGLK